MKKRHVIGALAIACVTLACVTLSAPASAQGVYLGFGGAPGYYGSGGYNGGYRDYRGSYAQDYRHCRVVRVFTGGHYRRIRRCY
jgi:hypothetical protein